MDLHVGLTACSAEKSNGGECKPIDYRITRGEHTRPGAAPKPAAH